MAQVARAQSPTAGGGPAVARAARRSSSAAWASRSRRSPSPRRSREVADGVATSTPRPSRTAARIIRTRQAELAWAESGPAPRIEVVLSPRQELLLGKVVDGFAAAGQPVGSKALAADPRLDCGPSTIRNELAVLEEHGLLAHPHTSAGRVPTDAGYRYFVDRAAARATPTAPSRARSSSRWCGARSTRRCASTTETLSQVTNLLAIVSAPPIETTTIRHVEVLRAPAAGADGRDHHLDRRRLQAGVHVRGADRPRARRLGGRATSTSGSSAWAWARGCCTRASPTRRCRRPSARSSPSSRPRSPSWPTTAEDTLYVDGAARLLAEHRFQDLAQLNALMEMLERRVSLLGVLSRRRWPSATSTCASAPRTPRPRCARCRWSPPTTACRSATSARSR